MRIVARRKSGSLFIEVAPERGRILTKDGRLWPEINVHSILSRGYWEDYTGPQDILAELLAEATVIELPPPQPPTRTDAEVRQWIQEKRAQGLLDHLPRRKPDPS